MSYVPPARPGSARVNYVDNLRIFLTALVMCHHQAIAFGAPGGWYYIVAQPTDILSVVLLTMFVAVNQAFFMSLFFFVAAYFTPASLDKKGLARFTLERLRRLGIPLVAYFFLLNPSVIYLALRFDDRIEPGYIRFMSEKAFDYVGWGPLWFVLSLLLFTSVYLGITVLRIRPGVRRPAKSLPNNQRILGFIVVIGLLTFLLRLVIPVGADLLGLQIAYFPLYIAFFIFGVQAYRAGWLEQLEPRQTTLWFRVALGLIAILPLIVVVSKVTNGADDAFRGGLNWQALVYAVWEPFVCVGICMKLLIVFRAFLNTSPKLTQLLAKSAYTAYIIHPFFVVSATGLAQSWPLPPALIFLSVSPLVVASCFFSANVIRQAPLLNKIL